MVIFINVQLLFAAFINHLEYGVVSEAGTFNFCIKIRHKSNKLLKSKFILKIIY